VSPIIERFCAITFVGRLMVSFHRHFSTHTRAADLKFFPLTNSPWSAATALKLFQCFVDQYQEIVKILSNSPKSSGAILLARAHFIFRLLSDRRFLESELKTQVHH